MRYPRPLLAPGLLLLILFIVSGLVWPSYQISHRRFTYVLVHGAYGGGWNWRQVDDLLSADGQKVFRPTLTGQGQEYHLAGPDVNLNTHIQDIVNTILFEDLHDVVLVGHSYGGMVVTGVADRIPDRIKCIIYLDAILPEDGESVDTAAGGVLHDPTKEKFDAQGSLIPTWLDPKKPLPHDEPEPGNAFHQPISLTNQKIARAIPSTYVLFVAKGTELEKARFHAFYLRAIARGWPVLTFESDHNAQWSHPRELAELLEKLP